MLGDAQPVRANPAGQSRPDGAKAQAEGRVGSAAETLILWLLRSHTWADGSVRGNCAGRREPQVRGHLVARCRAAGLQELQSAAGGGRGWSWSDLEAAFF